MGRFSLAVFGRKILPERCMIYAGAYVPARKERIKRLFDKWTFVRGNWLPYAFARKGRKTFLILFNVYGASMMLEVLHHIRDGGVKRVFFIGSMFAKKLPVGTLVLPTEALDKAGIVSIDSPGNTMPQAGRDSLRETSLSLKRHNLLFKEARIVSVPCVIHGIESIHEFVRKRDDIAGVEMELSTYFHFSRKLRLRSYALIYVSDNQRYDVISSARAVREVRRKALKYITKVAQELL